LNKLKVCLITPGHIATNPRLVKEVAALIEMGFQVHIVFTQYIESLKKEDQKIIGQYGGLTFDVLNWSGYGPMPYLRKITWGLTQKLSKKMAAKFPIDLFRKLALNRHYCWQLKKAVAANSDLYIAHNLGALAVAVNAAKRLQAKCGFDAEDFHRFELSDDKADQDVQLKIQVEEKYMPQADYLTAGSPLIAKAYEQVLTRKITSILNVFPAVNIPLKIERENTIKLFWFSQTIGPGRGIEIIIKAMALLNTPQLELHLLGECHEFYKNELSAVAMQLNLNSDQLVFHATVGPDDLFKMATAFDIGMATETGTPYNREICLTNKIFTYLQAGLAIVASNTLAQKELINEYPNMGLLYDKNDENSMAACLKYLLANGKLQEAKQQSATLALTTFNWEVESLKFKQLIAQVSGS
jgi:glycosyltransferase involved in cell wall biosynthesis